MMTPQELLDALSTLPPDAPLVFQTDAGPIRGGYHVTEWRQNQIQSIDCGARKSGWTEAILQLLDGSGGRHMTVGRFVTILGQSIRHVDGLADSPFQVEFAPGNAGLRLYRPEAPRQGDEAVTLRLTESAALCKPAQQALAGVVAAGCCGAA